MIELVKSERPIWHTFHRAWSRCVGLPRYDKLAWMALEDEALRVEEHQTRTAVEAFLSELERLQAEQGAT